MNQPLYNELQRFEIQIAENNLEQIEIAETVYKIPSGLQEFLGALLAGSLRKGPHIFFDRYEEGERLEYNSLTLQLDTGVLEEYDCISTAPYIIFALNGQYSNYMIRLDDDKPENPVVYYLGEGEYEEEPRTFQNDDGEDLRLLEFLQKSKPIWD